MIRYVRQWLAIRRLNKLVERNRNSYETQRYRERRAAQLGRCGSRRRSGVLRTEPVPVSALCAPAAIAGER